MPYMNFDFKKKVNQTEHKRKIIFQFLEHKPINYNVFRMVSIWSFFHQ